jgi:hypothetical protein
LAATGSSLSLVGLIIAGILKSFTSPLKDVTTKKALSGESFASEGNSR